MNKRARSLTITKQNCIDNFKEADVIPMRPTQDYMIHPMYISCSRNGNNKAQQKSERKHLIIGISSVVCNDNYIYLFIYR